MNGGSEVRYESGVTQQDLANMVDWPLHYSQSLASNHASLVLTRVIGGVIYQHQSWDENSNVVVSSPCFVPWPPGVNAL